MDTQNSTSLNFTGPFALRPKITNMFFNNKTVIYLTKHKNSTHQLLLFIGMAFIGGLIVGFLIRCLYYGIVKYFEYKMDNISDRHRQRAESQREGNANASFSVENDEPPDYVTAMADGSCTSVPGHRNGENKDDTNTKTSEELPPSYGSIVSVLVRDVRSASA